MDDALERYIKYLTAERNASPHTIDNYRREIAAFMAFARGQGVAAWADVTPPLLREWLADLHRQNYAKASVARRISELRAFYVYLHRQALVPSNPVMQISAPKLPQRLPRPLTEEEIKKLLAAPDAATPQGQRDRAMLELLYAGGLRVSELLALDVSDVNLALAEVRVTGKGDKERVALIGQPAVEAVRTYLADGRMRLTGEPGRRGAGGQGRRKTKALFLNRFGERLSISMFTRTLGDYAEAAGIEHPVTPHMFRHSFATHMLDGGADLRSVQELLGHESPSTTQIYTQVSQPHLRETVLNAHPRAGRNDERRMTNDE
ncbi:MAG: tyrosine recombinase XerC [Chloroflexi bacterium]|nr:tyrosine recombinase XerC [Chloroflexota bacterium]